MIALRCTDTLSGGKARGELGVAEWFRTAEAARRLGVHPQTLRLWERKGVIGPATRQRGLRVYTVEDVQRIRDAVLKVPARPPEGGARP